jgi:wobble nucleotide-excising tRNase
MYNCLLKLYYQGCNMLSNITLHNVASYREKQTVPNPNKRVNLFYGLNGSGKTTLSRYLKELENNSPLYADCSYAWQNNESCRVLVYNQDFIKNTFLQSLGVRGVFVGEDNKEALVAIEQAEQNRDALLTSQDSQKRRITEIIDSLNKLTDSLKEKTWKTKREYGHTIFKQAMSGSMGSEGAFLEKILNTSLVEKILNTSLVENISGTAEEFEKIQKEITALQSDENIIPDDLPTLELAEIETIVKNPLWGECIVNTQEGYLAAIVGALANNHQAWIEQGTQFVHAETEDCPFCQQSIDEKVRQALVKLVDDTYKRKKDEISTLQGQYAAIKSSIKNTTKQYTVIDNPSLQRIINQLFIKLQKNFQFTNEKIEQPSSALTLEGHEQEIEAINTIIAAENENRRKLREQMANKKQALQEAYKKFWQLVRSKYDSDIAEYQREKKKLEEEKTIAVEEQQKLQKAINEQNRIISEQRNKTKNIENAAESINRRLKSFSMQGFHLKKRDENSYFIARDNEQESEFEELSEGEKTLISFLYFVELCEEHKSDDPRKKLIVIDDPISSLSFNTVFEISCLIKSQFLKSTNKKYRSIFILTHHLYFLHELLKSPESNGCNLFRICKSPHSRIETMERNSIQNHYEGYWQVVLDAKKGVSGLFLANAMRNILEHFCAFVQKKDELSSIFNDLKIRNADKFTPFYRCMDRNNHSDATNIIDENSIEVSKFLEYFEAVFEALGHHDHYNCMMRIEKTDTPEEQSIAA